MSPANDLRVPASFADALRALRPLLHEAAAGLDAPTLEQLHVGRDREPALAGCTPLEPPGARDVGVASEPVVVAFLDGIQRSRLLGHWQGAPLVLGTVAAAVRWRSQRALRTWRTPLVERRLLAPRERLGEAAWARLRETGLPLDDTTADGSGAACPRHPHALRARAMDRVALERERLERQLAAAWLADATRPDGWLWIDGGLAGNLSWADDRSSPADAPAAARWRALGVVKSHATLYGDPDAVDAVLALRAGQRSPAFLVGQAPERAVASWYVRWHDPSPVDPLFGLVRVEVAPPAHTPPAHMPAASWTAWCDALTAGVLLERAPVSLPDARWHTLSYGVHDVERYLQALVGG